MGLSAHGQVGGQRSYEFLNIPDNALLTGLGGVNVSHADRDVNLFLSNPGLVGQDLSGHLSINYLSYFANTSITSVAYTHDFAKWGTWTFGAKHLDLGEIEGFDPLGNALGRVNSGETVLYLGRSHQVGAFRVGANLKFLFSNIADFRSSAVAADLGGVFIHPEKELKVGLAIKNIGFALSEFTETSDTELPFDVQLGVTFKPQYMPFRFSVTAYNLSRGDITFFNPAPEDPDDLAEEPGTVDKIFRRFVIGTELILSKNFNVRLGYNHLIRRELRLEETSGGAGFSYGFGLRIKAFEFSFARGGYHVAGGSNNFTLTSNLNRLIKKKTVDGAGNAAL